MKHKSIIFNYLSQNGSSKNVASFVEDIQSSNIKIYHKHNKKIIEDKNSIHIISIDDLSTNLITEAFKLKNNNDQQFIFLINGKEINILSTLARLGFSDLFIIPDETIQFRSYIEELIETKSGIETEPDFFISAFDSIIGKSEEIEISKSIGKRIAKFPELNILITGETGTGKSLFASAIHNYAKSEKTPLVEISCTSIPEALLESELYGHEKGAFTNAAFRKMGLFEVAENGTILLEEIADISQSIQSKLLRTVEHRIIRRIGGVEDIKFNARIISTTNKNLSQLVEENKFRRDLFFRLNTVTLEVPPLRNRGEDILILTNAFIKEYNKLFEKNIKKIDKELKELLLNYHWPGNVRELKNAIERGVLLSTDDHLEIDIFKEIIKPEQKAEFSFQKEKKVSLNIDYTNTTMEDLNILYSKAVFNAVKGNKSLASKLLGITRPTLDKYLSHTN